MSGPSVGGRKIRTDTVDLSGGKFGLLTVARPTNRNSRGNLLWECSCVCGEVVFRTSGSLRRSSRPACRNCRGTKLEDLTGRVFDKLTVVARAGNAGSATRWLCVCSCGKEVLAYGSNLRRQKTNKCRTCLLGNGSPAWKGFGEIPASYLTHVRRDARVRGLTYEVEGDYLWDLFLAQDRKCRFTGEVLTFNVRHNDHAARSASLDRIDSKTGYVEGNLQWVHKDINILKTNLPDGRFIELCQAVARHTIQDAQMHKEN